MSVPPGRVALDGGAPKCRFMLSCPLLQCIVVVVQGLCHAWMPCKNNSGFRHMKRNDGFDAPGDVGAHAGSELAAVCGMGNN